MLITYVTGNKVIFKTPPALSRTEFSMKCMLQDLSGFGTDDTGREPSLHNTHAGRRAVSKKKLSWSPDKS